MPNEEKVPMRKKFSRCVRLEIRKVKATKDFEGGSKEVPFSKGPDMERRVRGPRCALYEPGE